MTIETVHLIILGAVAFTLAAPPAFAALIDTFAWSLAATEARKRKRRVERTRRVERARREVEATAEALRSMAALRRRKRTRPAPDAPRPIPLLVDCDACDGFGERRGDDTDGELLPCAYCLGAAVDVPATADNVASLARDIRTHIASRIAEETALPSWDAATMADAHARIACVHFAAALAEAAPSGREYPWDTADRICRAVERILDAS